MKNKSLTIVLALLFAPTAFGTERSDSVTRRFEEIVVTGTGAPIAQRLLPYTVSVVGEQRLEASGPTRVLSVLSGMVPSMFVTERSILGFGVSSSGGSGHIKMRGVGGDRASGVLMMVDGQPQFAGIYSHHVADFYGKENVERVEVLRGPGSVLYGSNAMAGAVNIVTRNPEKRGVKTMLTSQYGSYNTWLSSLTNTTRFGGFSSLVSLSYNRTDGTQKNFDFRQAEGYVKLGYDISSQWRATADYTLMNLKGNDPIYPKLTNPETTDVYHQDITRGECSLTFSNNYGTTTGAGRVYYSYGNHFVDDPRHFHSLDDRLGVIVYESFRPWRDAGMTIGFDFDTYSGRIPVSGGNGHQEGSLTTISRKSITEYSPYLTLSQQLFKGILNLNGGLRMANSDKFHTQWVPQFGLSVNPGRGFTVKGNAAMGYRNPSFRELYLYRFANPDLEPEKMMNYEVSVGKYFSRYLQAELTGYLSRGANMIQTIDKKNQNTGKFTNKGIEVSMRSHPINELHVYFTYSFLHTSLKNLTGAPRQQYYIGLDYQPMEQIEIGADLKGVEGLYVADDVAMQDYALLNLKLTYNICRYISIFARIENITNSRYTINRGYRMPGTTVLGGFRLTI